MMQKISVLRLSIGIVGILYVFFSCSVKNKNVPELQTTDVVEITSNSAVSRGKLISAETNSLIECGFVWSTSENPTLENNDGFSTEMLDSGRFTGTINDLVAETSYFLCAYATNANGTGYGNEISFTTKPEDTYETMSDLEGNLYRIVNIDDQVWMAENLRTAKYNDGTDIQLVTDVSQWNDLTTGAYCWYDNDSAKYEKKYGKLYNWFVMNEDKICPDGWHVPSDDEWQKLEMYLGMIQNEANQSGVRGGTENIGGKMKESSTKFWISPNSGANNESGFTALPGGSRNSTYGWIGEQAYWWSSTELYSSSAFYRNLYANQTYVFRQATEKRTGMSIRCVKDQISIN